MKARFNGEVSGGQAFETIYEYLLDEPYQGHTQVWLQVTEEVPGTSYDTRVRVPDGATLLYKMHEHNPSRLLESLGYEIVKED